MCAYTIISNAWSGNSNSSAIKCCQTQSNTIENIQTQLNTIKQNINQAQSNQIKHYESQSYTIDQYLVGITNNFSCIGQPNPIIEHSVLLVGKKLSLIAFAY